MTNHDFLTFDTANMTPKECYQLLVNCVAPRPIAFVSSVSAKGVSNLAPFSFFMAGGSNPPSVAFSPSNNRRDEPKDTLVNIEQTGEFVVNIATWDIREPMNAAAAEFPYGVSEFEQTGLTPAPSLKVLPPRVLESPISMECRLFQIVRHGSGPAAANYVIGEVVQFHIRKDLFDGDNIDPTRVEYVGRLSGSWYSRANADSMFELERP